MLELEKHVIQGQEKFSCNAFQMLDGHFEFFVLSLKYDYFYILKECHQAAGVESRAFYGNKQRLYSSKSKSMHAFFKWY